MKKQILLFLIILLSIQKFRSEFLNLYDSIDFDVYDQENYANNKGQIMNSNPNKNPNLVIVNENSHNREINIKKNVNSNNNIVKSVISSSNLPPEFYEKKDLELQKNMLSNNQVAQNEKTAISPPVLRRKDKINYDIDTIESKGIASNIHKYRMRPKLLQSMSNGHFSGGNDMTNLHLIHKKTLQDSFVKDEVKEEYINNEPQTINIVNNEISNIQKPNLNKKENTETNNNNNTVDEKSITNKSENIKDKNTNLVAELARNKSNNVTVINRYFINDKSTILKAPNNPNIYNFYDKQLSTEKPIYHSSNIDPFIVPEIIKRNENEQQEFNVSDNQIFINKEFKNDDFNLENIAEKGENKGGNNSKEHYSLDNSSLNLQNTGFSGVMGDLKSYEEVNISQNQENKFRINNNKKGLEEEKANHQNISEYGNKKDESGKKNDEIFYVPITNSHSKKAEKNGTGINLNKLNKPSSLQPNLKHDSDSQDKRIENSAQIKNTPKELINSTLDKSGSTKVLNFIQKKNFIKSIKQKNHKRNKMKSHVKEKILNKRKKKTMIFSSKKRTKSNIEVRLKVRKLR